MFREESEERLDRIVDTLLAVERGDGAQDAVDQLFRDVHSIKGAAGMLGLAAADAIAHAMEDVLARARADGRIAADTIEPLLRASDALRRAVNGEEVAHDDATAALSALADPPPDEAPATGGPPRSLRVGAAELDAVIDTVGDTVLHHRRLEHLVRSQTPSADELDDALHRTDLRLDDLQHAVVQLRMVPLESITGPFPRMVRDVAMAAGKEVELTVTGADTQLDRVVLEGASGAISHLLRNAVAHGIEPPDERKRLGKPRCGRLELRGSARGDRVAIEVADDGRGVAEDLLARTEPGVPLIQVLAAPGVTREQSPTALSGRGVGLDAVLEHARALGGELEVQTATGSGTTFSLLLPISLAVLHVLLAERGDVLLGIPMSAVAEVVDARAPLELRNRTAVEVRGEQIVLADPLTALGDASTSSPYRHAIVATAGGARAALACDALVGDDEVLVKPLGTLLRGTEGYLGTALVGGGRVALIVDPSYVVPVAERSSAPRQAAQVESRAVPAVPAAKRILVVDDQFTAREIQRSILEAAGHHVLTARDGQEAWDLLGSGEAVDLVVTDVEMPEMDGFELVRRIREDADRSSVPVVMVTSRGAQEDERKGLEAGADAYVVKQRFDQRALLDTVERLVGG